jgi:hypothetical protein
VPGRPSRTRHSTSARSEHDRADRSVARRKHTPPPHGLHSSQVRPPFVRSLAAHVKAHNCEDWQPPPEAWGTPRRLQHAVTPHAAALLAPKALTFMLSPGPPGRPQIPEDFEGEEYTPALRDQLGRRPSLGVATPRACWPPTCLAGGHVYNRIAKPFAGAGQLMVNELGSQQRTPRRLFWPRARVRAKHGVGAAGAPATSPRSRVLARALRCELRLAC